MKKFNKDKYLRKIKVRRWLQNYSKYLYLGLSCILVCVLGIYFTFSKFFVSKEEEVVRTTVAPFIAGDVVITAYINNEYSQTVPGKDDGYVVDKVVCDNDAVGKWNDDKWGLLTTNISKRTKCNIYFKKYSNTYKIIELAQNDTVNFASDDPDNNIRYIGANPDNYIYFNCSDYSNQSDSTCEKWRIIGVFNNITKSDGTKENLLKIIKDQSIGTMAWDTNNINDWSASTLQQYLNNGDYYNTTLKNDNTRNSIENAVWNLGGNNNLYNTPNLLYERERGSSVYSGRSITWTGKISLLYSSDYAYATAGGSTYNRSTCLIKEMYYWNNFGDCYKNNYLYKGINEWTLTHDSAYANGVYFIEARGLESNFNADVVIRFRPSLFLKSNIYIMAGTGSSSNPYQLKID